VLADTVAVRVEDVAAVVWVAVGVAVVIGVLVITEPVVVAVVDAGVTVGFGVVMFVEGVAGFVEVVLEDVGEVVVPRLA
jgi:hypothetical protein